MVELETSARAAGFQTVAEYLQWKDHVRKTVAKMNPAENEVEVEQVPKDKVKELVRFYGHTAEVMAIFIEALGAREGGLAEKWAELTGEIILAKLADAVKLGCDDAELLDKVVEVAQRLLLASAKVNLPAERMSKLLRNGEVYVRAETMLAPAPRPAPAVARATGGYDI